MLYAVSSVATLLGSIYTSTFTSNFLTWNGTSCHSR